MLTPPLRLPASAWAVIERAIADAETAFAATTTAPTPITDGARKLAFIHHGDQTDKAAIQFVSTVFEAVVETMISAARDLAWSGEQLRVEVDTLLDQLIARVAARVPVSSAPDFRVRAGRAVRALPSWSALWDAIRAAPVSIAEPSTVVPIEAMEPSTVEPVETTETGTPEPSTLEPVEVAEPSAPEPVPSRADLAARRKQLLQDYKRAAGVTANKPIYESRDSGILKPEFYKWLKGELPSESATAINFERFLAQGRKPRPAS
jgi:hypothetical protein